MKKIVLSLVCGLALSTLVGCREYKASLKELEPTLQHHYRMNSHHPQHYGNGVQDMDLLDMVEMFVDWMAGSERNQGGNIFDSIDKNRDRFKMDEQLTNILKNTAERFP